MNVPWSGSARSPKPREIELWSWTLDVGADRLAHLAKTLSHEERERRGRFHFARDADRFVAARGQLRAVLAAYLGRDPASVCFDYNRYGKPFLENRALHFNLTHSEGLAALAVACDRAVGIDIERDRAMTEDMTDWVMTDRERRRFHALPPEARQEAFLRCWTRKEAVMKAIGDGLSLSPDRLEVSFEPHCPPRLLRLDDDRSETADWTLAAFSPAPGFVGAVAARGHGWILRPR